MATYYSPDTLKALLRNPSLSAIHFNARSLNKHCDEIYAFLSTLERNFSCICMTETWLSPDDKNLHSPLSYSSEYFYRSNSNHGGAAIFVSPSIKHKRRLDLELPVINCESVWIELEDCLLPSHSSKIILGCIYRSPSSSVSDFCTALNDLLSTISSEKQKVVIMGDININILDEENHTCIDYTNCFFGFGYESLITLPTRCVTGHAGTLIDHIFSNFMSPQHCGVVDVQITDHYPIFFAYPCHLPSSNRSFNTVRTDKDQFITRVSNVNWSTILASNDANDAYDQFALVINKCLNESTVTTKCQKKFPAPHNPWLTTGLLKSMRKKDNLYKKSKKQPYNIKLKARYNKYCNVLNKLLKEAKRKHYEAKIEQAGSDVSKQWKVINSFLNHKHEAPISELQSSGSVFYHPLDIANALNEFFCSNIPCSPVILEQHHQRSLHSFFMFPTSPDEVIKTIKATKITSAGLDQINPCNIKWVVHQIAEPLAHIINLVFKTGVFPTQLKRAKITPVFKKGDRTLISNYRPISILPFFSKVIEKCIVRRLNKYLSKFNTLSKHQFGFRAGHSTNLALLSFTDKIKYAIDSGNYAGALFIDLTKAFDSIIHSILFHKLTAIGVVGPALSLIQSYLSDRRQAVCVSQNLSNFKTTNKGVPQGSILGPLLFLIYINDLPNCVYNSEPFLYADDTTILATDKCLHSLTEKLTSDINNILLWCRQNCLHINASKTKFMIFHSSQRHLTHEPIISINNHAIQVVNQCMFLGVVLDSHLKYTQHISYLRTKAAHGIRILLKARHFFSVSTLLSLYYAFIHSHFTYCLSSWGNTYPTHLMPLQYIQNQAIRILTFSPFRSHASSLLQQLSILSINELFKYNLAILLFKSLHNMVPLNVFTRSSLVNVNSTRFASNHNLLLPNVHSNYGKQTANFAAFVFWNSLPTNVKLSSSLHLFKRGLLEFFLQP